MDDFRLIDYDQWATRVLLEQTLTLSEAQFVQEFAGPLSSVRQQAAHLVLVADRYRARIVGDPVPDWPPEAFHSARELVDYAAGVASRMSTMTTNLPADRLA